MHKRVLTKPMGGRWCSTRTRPCRRTRGSQSEFDRQRAESHLRWHPLRGEWVAYAGHRQHRTFLPPAEYNPLAPSRDGQHPTEVPAGPWGLPSSKLFPTLALTAHDPPAGPFQRAGAWRLRGGGVYAGRHCHAGNIVAVTPPPPH